MVKIVGKKATITFEVICQDEEAEKLLQTAITNTLNALVNQDIEQLKSLLSIPVQTKPKKEHKTIEEKFARENIETPELISLGGERAYSIAVVTDERNEKSVRVAKGKIRGNYYKDKNTGGMKLIPDDPMNPISLVNKINIKRMSEWQKLQTPILKRLQAIEETKK